MTRWMLTDKQGNVIDYAYETCREAADLAIGGAVLLGLGILNVGLILWEGLRPGSGGWLPSGSHRSVLARRVTKR